MANTFGNLLERYNDATEALKAATPGDYQKDRILRLREDIDAFRRDLKFLDGGGAIILSPDSGEIDSYVRPRELLGFYCFPIEERATFDLEYAKAQNNEASFVKDNETKKIGRRVLRARAHLFRRQIPNLLLPPHLEEFNAALSLIMSEGQESDLGAVFQMIIDGIAEMGKDSDHLLDEFSRWSDLGPAERSKLLTSIFELVVANTIFFSDDLALGKKNARINKIARAGDFLSNSNTFGIEDFDWATYLGRDDDKAARRLAELTPDKTLQAYIENLFFTLPSRSRSTLSIYADARALAYLASINSILHEAAPGKVKVQLVSWALSPVTVARALWPEHKESGTSISVEVRHPKLLAAAIDFDKLSRLQIEGDLERFSEALKLYEGERGTVRRGDQIGGVRTAWNQLDDTLLAWTVPIKAKADGATSDRIIKVTEIVTKNRQLFEKHLVKEIDRLSKGLSDTHWAEMQPTDASAVQADCLYYEPKTCLVLRPRIDRARFAVAIYTPELVELVHRSFENETLFGKTLVELAKFHGSFDDSVMSSASIRAERQLLRGFLFAVRDNSVLAVRYCQVARAELAQTQNESGIQGEIQYLSHYAYRKLGSEHHRVDDFSRSLRMLSQSQDTGKLASDPLAQRLKARYAVSWITTFREIAASEISDIRINDRWQEAGKAAYQDCLQLLKADLSRPAPGFERLDVYLRARATQNVMLAFLFQKLDIGTWNLLFSSFLKPSEDEAIEALKVMRSMREAHESWQLQRNMTRNDFAFLAGICLFDETDANRDKAREQLHKLNPALAADPAMQRALSLFLRHVRP